MEKKKKNGRHNYIKRHQGEGVKVARVRMCMSEDIIKSHTKMS